MDDIVKIGKEVLNVWAIILVLAVAIPIYTAPIWILYLVLKWLVGA